MSIGMLNCMLTGPTANFCRYIRANNWIVANFTTARSSPLIAVDEIMITLSSFDIDMSKDALI
jgi:hypothetical protein